jgi:hypothetical protein
MKQPSEKSGKRICVTSRKEGESLLKTDGPKVRLNLTLRGEPAKWLQELRLRGIIVSWHQGIVLAVEALHRELVNQELRAVQLRNLTSAVEDGSSE